MDNQKKNNTIDLKVLFSSLIIKPISLSMKSFQKISKLSNSQISLKYKKPNDTKSSIDIGKKSKFSSEEDSFQAFEKRDKVKYLLDSNEINLEEQKKIYIEKIGDLPTNEINLNYIKNDKHLYITQNYYILLFYWKLLHGILIIFNIILSYHLYHLFKDNIIKYSDTYSIIILIIISSTFISDIICLCNLILGKPIYVCNEGLNYLLIISFIFIFGSLTMSHLILKKAIYQYLIEKTKYQKIFESMLIIILVTLLLTFKMKEFYQDYQDNLPIKYSFLPNKEEVEKIKQNFENKKVININSEEIDNDYKNIEII
jgi:hypothetical protein